MKETATERIPAEVFPPGEYVKDELEARGWSQADLAAILGRPAKIVSDIVSGKSSITPETAQGLGEAFGTSAQVWMNLDSAYRLWRLRAQGNGSDVARRARLFQLGPINEMCRRGWIDSSNNLSVLEKRVADFYGLGDVSEEPVFRHAARKSTSYADVSEAQRAWLFWARALSRRLDVKEFSSSERARKVLEDNLKKLMEKAEDVGQVPAVLADAGIRFVIVEPLAGTKIDGACFWLSAKRPVIALSMRFDRIDWFWHTLLHELEHVHQGDGQHVSLDVSLVGKDAVPFDKKPAAEKRADKYAASFSVDQKKLMAFISRVRPLFSTKKILAFAESMGVHPGIVVGQLQFKRVIPYSHSRKLLVKVREHVIPTALADGWGIRPRP